MNGNIKNKFGKIIKQTSDKYGYLYIGANPVHGRKAAKSHRMVAMAFIPNPENKPTVNHKNGIKSDNRGCNLGWATYKENIRHAIDSGLKICLRGENGPSCKLSEIKVKRIRKLLKVGMLQRDIAKEYNVSISLISHINIGRKWQYLK